MALGFNWQWMRMRVVILNSKMKTLLIILFFALTALFTPLLVKASVPVWVTNFDECTEFQQRMESFEYSLHSTLLQKQLDTEAARELARVEKARFDVNRLVASVYDELRTTQVNLPDEKAKVLQSIGIAVGMNTENKEFCKASYEARANIGEGEQCIAVQQEARIITNIDDYVFEEPIRKAADFLFCYLGDWRHFPIDEINSDYNCEKLIESKGCSEQDIISALDLSGEDFINGKIGIGEVCEAMRKKDIKCSADIMRDTIKYDTLNQIARKDRTSTLMPPQTWYTPDRCKIIESVLPIKAPCTIANNGNDSSTSCATPFTKNIKRITNDDATSIYGNPTLKLTPDNDPIWSFAKVLESFQVPENSVNRLKEKTFNQAQEIINDYTELNKIQYQTGKGLRPATYIIGFKDYLNSKTFEILKKDKIINPLPAYWENGEPEGQYFFFDTGIVISPTVILLDKLESAIQAQFDLARDTFAFIGSDGTNPDNYPRIDYNSETISGSSIRGINTNSIIQNNLSYQNSSINLGLITTIGSKSVNIKTVTEVLKGAGLSNSAIQSTLTSNIPDYKKISDSVSELYNQKADPEVISVFTNMVWGGINKNIVIEAVADMAVKKIPADYIGSTINGLSNGKIDTDSATNIVNELIKSGTNYKNIGNIIGEISTNEISIDSIKTIAFTIENLGVLPDTIKNVTNTLSNKIIPANIINSAENFLSSIGVNDAATNIIKNTFNGKSLSANSIKNSLLNLAKEKVTVENIKTLFKKFGKIDAITSSEAIKESIKSEVNSNIIGSAISPLLDVEDSSVPQIINNLTGVNPDIIGITASLMSRDFKSLGVPMAEKLLGASGVPSGVIKAITNLFPGSRSGASANTCQSFTEEWLKPGPLNINSLLLNPTLPEQELLPPPYYDQAITFNLDTGTPLQNKITEDIGDFEQNYFTQFYNNVLQLYKTPFSQVLENWFKPFDNADSNSIFK